MNLWKLNKLKLFLDLTTRCNAGCPICHRTEPGTVNTAEWLREYSWTYE